MTTDLNPAKPRKTFDPQGSELTGLAGFYEKLLRKFKVAIHILTLMPLYLVASLCFGLALTPAVALWHWVHDAVATFSTTVRYLSYGTTIGAGFFVFGFSLILVVPAVNFLFRARLKPWRGAYYSSQCVKWYIHNGLTYLVRYSFLEFVTPTPLNHLFYRLMGMKIGRGSQINTTQISDPSLIEIGEQVTVGGSANLLAHYGVGGFLVIAPVIIGKGATIGLRATLMGGVEVGEFAKILPNSVVLPKTKIPAGETWGGVPAQKIVFESSKTSRKPAA